MISLPIPMALKSFLQADILNILLYHWGKKKIQRAEVVSNSWPGSSCIKEKAAVPCGIAVRELPQISRGKNWRNPIVPEHSTMLRAACCPEQPWAGSQAGDPSESPTGRNSEEEIIGASWAARGTSPCGQPSSIRELCSPPSQKPAGSCFSLIWPSRAQGSVLPWIRAGSADATRSETITNTSQTLLSCCLHFSETFPHRCLAVLLHDHREKCSVHRVGNQLSLPRLGRQEQSSQHTSVYGLWTEIMSY